MIFLKSRIKKVHGLWEILMTMVSMNLFPFLQVRGEIVFFQSDKDGFSGTVETFPSFRGISDISLHNHEDKAHLLIVSPEEEVLGLSSYDENKGFSFPKLINLEGIPILASGHASEKNTILIICEEDSKYFLKTLQIGNSGSYEEKNSFHLNDLKENPNPFFNVI